MTRVHPPPPPPQAYRLGGIVRYDKQPPRGIRRYLWKKGVQTDAHLCFAMLEWWEALVVALLFLPVTLLFWFSVYKYFPGHIKYLAARSSYYLYGDENVDLLACTRGYIAEWLNMAWLSILSIVNSAQSASRVDL